MVRYKIYLVRDIKLNYETNLVLFYGITFGIIFMTIVYTMIRYIYSKEMIYISYSFMQIFSLGFLIVHSKLFYDSFVMEDLLLLFATFSAIVFSLSFYKGKFLPNITNTKELIFNTFLLNVVILTSLYHYILFEYIPYTVIYAILFISIIFNMKQAHKPTLIYIIGWSIFCMALFVFDFKTYYIQKGYMDILLVAFAIEAVLFTISISYKYSDLQKRSDEYEEMFLQQSKLAKTGEMINNIAHQFRQPLNSISYIMINLKKRFENKKLEENYFKKKIGQVDEQLSFLSKTIDDFQSFYKPLKEKSVFLVDDALQSALTIVSSDIKKYNVNLDLDYKVDKNIKVFGIQNELSQVFLAIISNAIYRIKNLEYPNIKISVYSNSAEVNISISNNGEKIDNKIIEKIFDRSFSTKKNGTGIGLFLSKLIIEKTFLGKIKVENLNEGVEFTLILEKAI